jgi:maleylpyruvate isomerase
MSDDIPLRLHGYWRSSAAYRVRIALNYKDLSYQQVAHDLREGEQDEAGYKQLAPLGLVPTLEAGEFPISQSLAIIEWLDESFPDPPLLPLGPNNRAIVRAMAATVACDIHPLNNLRVLNALRSDFGAEREQVLAWAKRWISSGFAALEVMVAKHGGDFAFGDYPTIADCCLVPQFYSAERFEVGLAPYPELRRRVENALDVPAFAAAHPSVQPDADLDTA